MSILSSSPNELIKVSESRIPPCSFILPFPLKKTEHFLLPYSREKTLVTLHDTDSHHLFEVFLPSFSLSPLTTHTQVLLHEVLKTTGCLKPFWLWGCLNPSGMMVTLSFIPKGTEHMSMYPTHLCDYGYFLSSLQGNEMLEQGLVLITALVCLGCHKEIS